jgi:hypothetical protein
VIEDLATVAGGKKENPNYMQVSGHVPKPLGLKFKTVCTASEMTISEAMEEALKAWLKSRGESEE